MRRNNHLGRNRGRSNRDEIIFYGTDDTVVTEQTLIDNFVPPIAGILPVDDVTGDYVPTRFITFQDGLLKDSRISEGSIENELRYYKNLWFIMYNPACGFPNKAAGE